MFKIQPRVAVVGATGQLAMPVLDALTSPEFRDEYSMPIRALTRSTIEDTDDIHYCEVSYDNPNSLDQALDGVDIVIDVTGPHVDATPIIDSATRQRVSVYFTSDYSVDQAGKLLTKEVEQKYKNAEYARQQKFHKVVQIVCGVFTEWLADHMELVGIDDKEHSYTQLGEGEFRISTTSLGDVGFTLASLAYRPPQRLPRVLRVHGDNLTCNEIASIYEKLKGVQLTRMHEVNPDEILHRYRYKENDTGISKLQAYLVHSLQPLDMTLKTQNEVANAGYWAWSKFEDVAKVCWT